MKNLSSEDQDFDLWVLVDRTRMAMFRARRKELEKYNILPRQAAILHIIEALGDKARPKDMSEWLFRTTHSVSELASRMEKRGFVRKVKDYHRRDLLRYVLTEEGRAIYNKTKRRESIHRIISVLSKEERQQFEKCLGKLRLEALKELGEK